MSRVARWLFRPVGLNASFIVFMYALGMLCTLATAASRPRFHIYPDAPWELFFDVYLLAALLCLLPAKARRWTRRAIYVVAYAAALADLYCYVKLGSTITPTMLLLVLETNTREVGEFLLSYLSPDVLATRMGLVVLLMAVHALWAVALSRRAGTRAESGERVAPAGARSAALRGAGPWLGVALAALFVFCGARCLGNKAAFLRLMSCKNIGEVEHELTRKDHAVLYQPVYRLVFSAYSNTLAAKQLARLKRNLGTVQVDSCSFLSRNIVLVIGESFNRHHSSLYGYPVPTTPRQRERFMRGELIPFSDVVAPWNLTSFVFKHLFTTYAVGDGGEWCDYPLFPEIFRKAGYRVTFLTNQFLPRAGEAVYDFSGGFFLNDRALSEAMFDTRNASVHRFDELLLSDFDDLDRRDGPGNLVIFHLLGQHVDYKTRFPRGRRHLGPGDYSRPELSGRELRVLSEYDNAILYNDSVVDAIIGRFEDEDAVVIYVPDHGEECFDGGVHFYGRMHSAELTPRLVGAEFDIPFWIWCSHDYVVGHPDLYRDMLGAKDRPYMTDALPHMLLFLAGISTPAYRDDLNVLAPGYDASRPRIIKASGDYDEIMASRGEGDEP